MKQETKRWTLRGDEWERLLARVRGDNDLLADGAYARVAGDPETGTDELHFFATAANCPEGWRFTFQESVPGGDAPGAFIGRAWRESESDDIQFEITLYAGAQAVSADYAGGAGDMDEMEFEQAISRALQGTPADNRWMTEEFGRLIWLGAAH